LLLARAQRYHRGSGRTQTRYRKSVVGRTGEVARAGRQQWEVLMAGYGPVLSRNAQRRGLTGLVVLVLLAQGCSGGDSSDDTYVVHSDATTQDGGELDGAQEASGDAGSDAQAADADASQLSDGADVADTSLDAASEVADASLEVTDDSEPGTDAGDAGGDEQGPCEEQPEKCNGLDDNCNGVKDEGDPGGGIDCTVPAKLGECASGTTHCSSGSLKCVSNVPPSPEICDGKDNDCDGVEDEDTIDTGSSCNTGKPGVCAVGTLTCQAGALTCTPNLTPSVETCNGLDDDCDGMVDNGFPGTGLPCVVNGQNPNTPCAQGQTNCLGGQNGCTQVVFPSPESCDGVDNDCNGTIDDAGMVQGLACSTGLAGICATGKTQCAGGVSTCVPDVQPGSQLEVCNGKDDNCSGVIDDVSNIKLECGTKYPSAQMVAAWVCTSGACQVFGCNPGYKDCDGALTNGCEVNGNTDLANCGLCGNVCSTSNATPSCVSGQCQLQCHAGRGNCDGNAGNGCEIDLLNDPAHCGTCTTVCPSQSGTPICKAGVCGVSNGAHSGLDLVSGALVGSSPNYRVIMTLGQGPGGNGIHTSSNYRIVGGLVGATQKP
jgi:hypothetical protein